LNGLRRERAVIVRSRRLLNGDGRPIKLIVRGARISTTMRHIREYQATDWPAIWPMLQATFLAGDTYTFSPQSTEREIRVAWVEVPANTFVACDSDGRILGTYFIKPNQPGLGAHVCNCGYVVAPQAQGQGVATLMCEHSQAEAIAMGFRAMQFNFVVATNVRAIRLWEKLGFSVVGRLPGAFRHPQLGYIDALVMFKTLVP
jgi:ribosomal protein S18 acetylase RimI-like enzyme